MYPWIKGALHAGSQGKIVGTSSNTASSNYTESFMCFAYLPLGFYTLFTTKLLYKYPKSVNCTIAANRKDRVFSVYRAKTVCSR